MSKTHFPRNLTTYTKVQAKGNLMTLLAQPTVCGQRPNRRPNVEVTTDRGQITCSKCLAATAELTVAEQMRAAHAAGDLDEVIRLAESL